MTLYCRFSYYPRAEGRCARAANVRKNNGCWKKSSYIEKIKCRTAAKKKKKKKEEEEEEEVIMYSSVHLIMSNVFRAVVMVISV